MSKELLTMIKPLKKVVNDDFYVLTNDEHPTEPRTYRNYYSKLMTKLGIPKLKYHGLRHSFATRCIEAGCDYKTVSVLLGHSNISTTLNLYVHPNMEQKKRCISKMFKSLVSVSAFIPCSNQKSSNSFLAVTAFPICQAKVPCIYQVSYLAAIPLFCR